ncbi:MAG TPA: Ig-like domain-containing protein [Jiangellaceae bacterium]|nr:Ig-like domain-containing protein [Jiangellaceae bacterium]
MRRPTTILFGILIAVLLAACGGSGGGGAGASGGRAPGALPRLIGVEAEMPYDAPVSLGVQHATIDSVEVVPDGGEPLAGLVGDDGRTWSSDAAPEPGGSYAVTVVASDTYGTPHTLTTSFTVTGVPDSDRLTLSVQPGDGEVVGVGAPIVVRFDQSVSEQEAVEQAMHVASSPQVVGSWHWVNSKEVHFRPKEYWPAGTKVAVSLDLNGVQAGDGLWGGRSYDIAFEVGRSQVAQVDAATHTMSIVVDGKTTATWNTSLGAPEFATRNGTYVVLSKEDKRQMTSCNANITCDKNSPEFYDLEVTWTVRLSWSGTFVHSAPWSEGAQGSANVSHGCINLSDANGHAFFDMVRYGDLVTVANSTRGPEDLVSRGDPGMADWNMPWTQYVAESALGAEVTTDAL